MGSGSYSEVAGSEAERLSSNHRASASSGDEGPVYTGSSAAEEPVHIRHRHFETLPVFQFEAARDHSVGPVHTTQDEEPFHPAHRHQDVRWGKSLGEENGMQGGVGLVMKLVHTSQLGEPIHNSPARESLNTWGHSSDWGSKESARLGPEEPIHDGEERTRLLSEEPVHTKEGRLSHDSDWSLEEVNVWPSKKQLFSEVARQGALAGPIMGMNVVWFLRSIVSMVFLGHLGELELAAGSLAISLANVTGYSILYGLSTGLEPLISQAYGAKRYHTMGRILNRGIVILLVACMPIAIVWIYAEDLLLLMKQDPEIAREAGRYLRWQLLDLVALAGAQPVRVYLRSQGLTFPLIPCAVIAFAFHIPTNYILIYWVKMGSAGAALSSAVTDFNVLFLMICYIRWLGVHKKSWTGFSIRSCLSEWGPFLRLAAPSCLATCLEWWAYELLLLFAGLLKDPVRSIAAMTVCLNLSSLCYMVPAALSSSLSARVGNELGANSPSLARLASQVAGCVGTVMGAVSATILVLTRGQIGRLFTDNEDLLKLIASILPLVAMCHVADSPQTTLSGALRGMARPTVYMIANLSSYYGIGMPIALALAFHAHFGVPGMWMGLFCAQIIQLILVTVLVFRTDWAAQAMNAQELLRENDPGKDEISDKGFELADLEKQDIDDVYGHEAEDE